MKESVIRSVRVECGLGNPPAEYTTNDVEAANFMIKYSLNVEPRNPHVFIEAVRNIIETQFRSEDRAVFGKGPYEIQKEFQHFSVSDKKKGQLTSE